jgi:hypothetical protein
VLKHIITLFRKDKKIFDQELLKGVYDWKGFELRLIDDYENVYEPDYDV